ncbi:MAG: sugar phosphate isomerase/epimerase family protein [Solirubrobacteraceae bacterium]
MDRDRLSLNLITVDHWSLPKAVDRCAAAGIRAVAPWRHRIAEIGLERSARAIRDAGLAISSLCRGGFFTAAGADADNRRAVQEAAALGAPVLVLVCGPPTTRDLAAARAKIAAGIERLLPYAADHGVRLGIEPLHPMMIGERSAIVTLGEALALARELDSPHVGVVVDSYHVFWDPALEDELGAARGLIAGYHVSDWLVPTTDLLAGRGLMGDGIIDFARLHRLMDGAGYAGPIEVEIINPAVAGRPRLLEDIVDRFTA